MQARRHDGIPRTGLLDWRILGKRASDQTQACQQRQNNDRMEGGTTSSSHDSTFLLESLLLIDAGEPGRDETPSGSAEIQFPFRPGAEFANRE